MGTEEKDVKNLQQAEKVSEKIRPLEEISPALVKYGGFTILATTIDGTQNLNPEKKALKKIFLGESDKKELRKALKKRLLLIQQLLSTSEKAAELTEHAQNKAESTQSLLNKNIKKALEATRELEQSYRTVKNFFVNTGESKLKNLSVMNAPKDMLTDLDQPVYIDFVAAELEQYYDRLDLRENYSLLVLPGYLGSKKVIDKWARIAHKNKVMMLTDFIHFDGSDEVIEEFQRADLSGSDAYLSNAMLTCNWVVGRGKQQDVGEEDDVCVPASSALAGLMYRLPMSQVGAGLKYGSLNEVDGVRFPLKKGEIAQLEKLGLIPMVNEFGKVMGFSAKTLFNGDNLGLQTYSVVRVFDYVAKVLMDYLNRMTFVNFDFNAKMDMQKQIAKFLDSITGPKGIIEKFKIMRFEQDPQQRDKIYLDIHIVPYFPAKSFMIKLDGQKGDDPDSPEWQSEYAQQK